MSTNSFGRRRTDRLRQRSCDDLIARQQILALFRQQPLPTPARLLIEAIDKGEGDLEVLYDALLQAVTE